MPQYRVTDPATGRTVRLTGETPPTEAELEQVFKSLRTPETSGGPAPVAAASSQRRPTLADPAVDALIGMAKGAGESATWLADRLIRPLPGMAAVERAVPPLTYSTAPTNTAQSIGKAAERLAEVVIPGRGIAVLGTKAAGLVAPRLATATRATLEGAGAAGIAAVQGGDPTTAAALGAMVPVVGATAGAVVPMLRRQAATKVEQALGPTKERYKAMAKRLTPQILKRGLGGSRESLLARATETAETAGDQIDEAIEQFGARQVGVSSVTDALESAKSAFREPVRMSAREAIQKGLLERATDAGNGMVDVLVEFEPRAIKQLADLQQILGELGDGATVKQLVNVRRAWDRVVDQAGGFAHRGGGAIGVPLKDQSEAWAKREATGAIRELLARETPELAAVNKEFAFWKGLKDVLAQTVDRTAPQQGGLRKAVAEVAGAAAGSSGGLGAAWATGKAAGLAHQVFTSPRWRFVDARMRDQLANAIESGSQARITHMLGRIAAVEASHVPAMAR